MTWMQWIGDIGEDQWGLLAVATLGLSVCHALLAAYFLGIYSLRTTTCTAWPEG